MHIAEGFLPVSQAIGWTIAAAPFVVHGAVSVNKQIKEKPETGMLLGAAGAFTFVLSAIKKLRGSGVWIIFIGMKDHAPNSHN